ncbi:MAG: type II toxin-antitoxin system VapC family toxin [Candidatus Omnitrophica bacterium]|nr:type II toxin-antitoxin system VapC family toxin [Candidatus Omnitrophota bacterium]
MLIDSSGWLEFFTEGPLASEYAAHLKHLPTVVTPAIVLYEVYKIIKRQRSEEEALAAIAQMGKTRIIPLTDTIALTAADLSLAHRLGMADAIIYATALTEGVKVVTSAADLALLPDVTYLKKP